MMREMWEKSDAQYQEGFDVLLTQLKAGSS